MGYDVDREPAAYAKARARAHNRWVILLFGAAVGLLVLLLYAGFGSGSTVLVLVAVVAIYAVSRRFDRQLELVRRWTIGARAETAVGVGLNELRSRGFIVMHDVAQQGASSSRPSPGVYQAHHLTKAKRQAAKLHDALSVWVTPVVCRPGGKVFQHEGVWIVPPGRLVAWIERQDNKPCAADRLAAFADSLA